MALYLGRDWTVEHDQEAPVANATLRYADVGNPNGEPIICIHGTNIADSLITPLKFYPKLFEDFRLISYYRAGYNGSTLEKDSVSIEEGADHAVQLLDHLNIDKAHFLAFSFGGVIGFQAMLCHPKRVHTAALLEAYLPRESQAAIDANIAAFMKAMEMFQAGNKLEGAMSYMEDVCGPRFLGAVDMTGPIDVWDRVAESVDIAFTIDFPAISNWEFAPSKADELVDEKPNMPVLAVMGMDSEAAMPGFRETQSWLMNWLPQAERAAIPYATHGMQSMNPVAVGEAVYTFFRKYKM
jgi:pimeloyl-ACP methyl ester carboxylesterase